MTLPRYRQLASALRADITEGRYGVGDHLPPEMELCQIYAASRHTVRDALRLLREAGLVQRRRGAGTTVIANEIAPSFVQPLGGPETLTQYAREAKLIVRAANAYQVDKMLVPIVVLGILGVSLTALLRMLELRVAPWMAADRTS